MFYKNLFYFDIETVGEHEDIHSFSVNDVVGHRLFKEKYENSDWMVNKSKTLEKAYLDFAPLYSSFGKIVCISFGYYHDKTTQGYTVSSICGEDEFEIIKQFQTLVDKVSKKHMLLSGYFVKAFDIPWVIHKMNKYNLELPKLLDIYGKKPWEIPAFDLAEEWKQGFKNYMSLNEVAYELGVLCLDDEIDGKQCHDVYWKEGNLAKIKRHCECDITNSMRVAERMLKYKIV
jgi:predicted PolB exonuclease-like 3'-5' exonuclease